MSPLPERDVAQILSAQYVRQVGRVADSLRRYADQAEREGRSIQTGISGTSLVGVNHTRAAANVIHELQTMFANLPLDGLLLTARDADDAHRGAVAAEKAADESAQPVRKTPQEWAADQFKRIVDPDGWREPGSPPFDQPCTYEEFLPRFAACTVAPLQSERQS